MEQNRARTSRGTPDAHCRILDTPHPSERRRAGASSGAATRNLSSFHLARPLLCRHDDCRGRVFRGPTHSYVELSLDRLAPEPFRSRPHAPFAYARAPFRRNETHAHRWSPSHGKEPTLGGRAPHERGVLSGVLCLRFAPRTRNSNAQWRRGGGVLIDRALPSGVPSATLPPRSPPLSSTAGPTPRG